MIDFHISNRSKVLLICFIIIPLIFLFFWVNYNNIFNPKSSKDIFLDLRKQDDCIGRIDSIYRQKMNHNILTLGTKNCQLQVDAEWEREFKVGDSISKMRGKLILEHYRGNKLYQVLDYEDLRR